MSLLEWYLGLPPASSGQGTDWGFRTHAVWGAHSPPWLVALVSLVVLAGVVAIYWRDARSLSPLARTGLLGLRLLSLLVLVVMLSRLTLTLTRTGLPILALLIDTSASMSLEDATAKLSAGDAVAPAGTETTQPASGEQSNRRPSRRLGTSGGDEGGSSRLALVKRLLTGEDGRFLGELLATHRLQLFQFAESAASLDVAVTPADATQPRFGERPSDLQALLAAVHRLEPLGNETRLASAVRQVLEDLRGNTPIAVVILTDGIPSSSEEEALSAAARDARDRSVPLIAIGVGSTEPVRDLQLYDALGDDVAFVDDPVTFSFQVKGFGFAGETARISLRQQGVPGVLQTLDLAIGRDGQPVAAEMTHIPKDEGEHEYVMEATIVPPTGPAAAAQTAETNLENNLVRHRVQVRREQLRVLIVERLPRWEFRHLKPVLERDRAIEVRTVLQQADVSFSEEDRTALPRFPVSRDELMEYDVIIWGDVDLSYLSPGALEHLQEFVAERGGGLILIAGEGHNPLAYRETLLEDLLPVEIPAANSLSVASLGPTGFRPELTVEGRSRSALRLANTTEENEQLWRALPPLYWLHPTGRRKPAAQVLAVHPTQHGDGGPLPVIVTQRFGAGQVLFHATDELWQWRRHVEDRHVGRYWLQMVRYLSRSKLRSNVGGIELVTDRTVYEQGEAVEVRARFVDPQTVPVADDGARVVVEGPGGRRETVTLTRIPEAPNLFAGRLSQLAAGTYHAWLAEPVLSSAPDANTPREPRDSTTDEGLRGDVPSVPSTDFRVELASGELRDRTFREDDLQAAAKVSRGAYYPIRDGARFLEEIPPGRAVPVSSEQMVPLWNRWELLLLLTGLLSVEWITRKRCGLV